MVRAPREGFEEIPEKSRNLVLLGLPVSQPGMNSQLEQGKSPWMLEGEGLRSTCPDPGTTQLTRGSPQPASAPGCPSKVVLARLTPAPTAALGSSQPDSTHVCQMVPAQLALGLGAHTATTNAPDPTVTFPGLRSLSPSNWPAKARQSTLPQDACSSYTGHSRRCWFANFIETAK